MYNEVREFNFWLRAVLKNSKKSKSEASLLFQLFSAERLTRGRNSVLNQYDNHFKQSTLLKKLLGFTVVSSRYLFVQLVRRAVIREIPMAAPRKAAFKQQKEVSQCYSHRR